jgi:hypothetical protein
MDEAFEQVKTKRKRCEIALTSLSTNGKQYRKALLDTVGLSPNDKKLRSMGQQARRSEIYGLHFLRL